MIEDESVSAWASTGQVEPSPGMADDHQMHVQRLARLDGRDRGQRSEHIRIKGPETSRKYIIIILYIYRRLSCDIS